MNKYLRFAEHSGGPAAIYQTVIVLDVSPSMDETDWLPSRLSGAVQAAGNFLDIKEQRHPDDQVGLVTFCGTAKALHPIAPIRSCLASIRAAMNGISTGLSTSLTAGLTMAVKLYSDCCTAAGRSAQGAGQASLAPAAVSADPIRQIILLTDGEHNTGPDPVPYALEAKQAGFVIDVIGIGTPAGLDETSLRRLASPDPDAVPSYCFIGDAAALSEKMRQLAQHHIQPLGT